jgi:hypothetical protein
LAILEHILFAFRDCKSISWISFFVDLCQKLHENFNHKNSIIRYCCLMLMKLNRLNLNKSNQTYYGISEKKFLKLFRYQSFAKNSSSLAIEHFSKYSQALSCFTVHIQTSYCVGCRLWNTS